MGPEAKELWALRKALMDDPTDTDTRLVLADWLEEHDAPELADEQRNWSVDDYEDQMHEKYDSSWNDYDRCAC